MKGSIITGIAAAACVLAFSAPAGAATHHGPRIYTFGRCSAQGDFATCVTNGGSINHPAKIWIHVTATPRQKVDDISWDALCSKGLGDGSSSGQFSATTPVNHLIHHPYRDPDNCIVSADGQLSGSGHLHITLIATKA
jgi:hypothetical protein